MTAVHESIDVAVPLREAYRRWTTFEDFPQFMKGVKSVRREGETTVHWVTEVAGHQKEWDATITRWEPESRIAWEADDGSANRGEVVFEALGAEHTRIAVTMSFEPEGLIEKAGAALGVARHQVHHDLERFREIAEDSHNTTVDRVLGLDHDNAPDHPVSVEDDRPLIGATGTDAGTSSADPDAGRDRDRDDDLRRRL